MGRYYRRNGTPCKLMEWAKAFEDREQKIVRRTDVGNVLISTVWLGLDHRFGPGGPPLIFETLVFGGTLDQEQNRYSTEEEAIAGHQAMVERVKQEPPHVQT